MTNAACNSATLAGCDGVGTPYDEPNNPMIDNQSVIRIPGKRDAVEAPLNVKKIGSATCYPLPLHLQECLTDLGHEGGNSPHAKEAAKEVLTPRVYPELADVQKDEVVTTGLGVVEWGPAKGSVCFRIAHGPQPIRYRVSSYLQQDCADLRHQEGARTWESPSAGSRLLWRRIAKLRGARFWHSEICCTWDR